MEIRTARLLLRRERADDVGAYFAILSDPRAMRYWSTLPHEDMTVTQAWLQRSLDRQSTGGDNFAIELDGRLIGQVGAGRLPEFGFILAPDHWGQGYGYEAASAYLAHAFADPELEAVTADVDPRNAASLRLLERLGFAVTGHAERTFLLGDEWCDSVYLAVTRQSWLEREDGLHG